jgi:hypothetical protein
MIYAILTTYLLAFSSLLLKRKARLVPFLISSLLITFVLGLRSGFLTDYNNYIDRIAYMYRSQTFFGRGYDPFFDVVTWVSFNIGAPEYFVLFVYFALTFFLLLRVIWHYSPSCAFSFLVLICVAPLDSSLNITRQVLAFAIVLYGFFRFFKTRFYAYELFVLSVAFLVHGTVIIMLPLRVFGRLPSNFGFWLILVLSAIPLNVIAMQLVELIIHFYSQSSLPYAKYFINTRYLFKDMSDSGIVLYANLCIALWVAYKLPGMRDFRMYSVICKTYIVGIVVTFVFMDFQLFVRLMQNYTWVAFMAFPIALSFYRDYWIRIFSLFCLTAYCIVMLLLWFIRLEASFDGGGHVIFN